MNDNSTILSYFSKIHADYIHAFGKLATELLIQHIDCKENSTVLEIGCGTGATLVKLASRNRNSTFYGIDISDLMLKKAASRINFCGLSKHIQLKKVDIPYKIPFENQFFDTIYAESVLGIQEEEGLDRMFEEIYRVLKPNGKLVLNETIWLPTVSKQEITDINTKCKTAYGIIQANGKYSYAADWVSCLTTHSFHVQKIEPLEKLLHASKSKANKAEIRSFLYSFFGKIRGKLDIKLGREYAQYAKEMAAIYEPNRKYMEGYIIVACK